MKRPLAALLILASTCLGTGLGQEASDGASTPTHPPTDVKLPGLVINLQEHCVDVEAEVCLDEGSLELVACTVGSKEHESIVAVKAKAMHIHTALLLLGAVPGSPAMHRQVGEGPGGWIPVPPRGGPVEVFLLVKDDAGKLQERPIVDFIRRIEEPGTRKDAAEEVRFPSATFLFAGSHLKTMDDGPRRYLADGSGNVISIATFGDELLCRPGLHGHEDAGLMWEVDPTHLPDAGSQVTLRLRPKLAKEDEQQGNKASP